MSCGTVWVSINVTWKIIRRTRSSKIRWAAITVWTAILSVCRIRRKCFSICVRPTLVPYWSMEIKWRSWIRRPIRPFLHWSILLGILPENMSLSLWIKPSKRFIWTIGIGWRYSTRPRMWSSMIRKSMRSWLLRCCLQRERSRLSLHFPRMEIRSISVRLKPVRCPRNTIKWDTIYAQSRSIPLHAVSGR